MAHTPWSTAATPANTGWNQSGWDQTYEIDRETPGAVLAHTPFSGPTNSYNHNTQESAGKDI